MLSLLPQQETVSRLYTEDREGLLKMVAFDLTSERCKSAQSCNNLGQEHSRQRKERVLSLKVGTGLRSEEEGQCDCVSSLGGWVVNEVREGGGSGSMDSVGEARSWLFHCTAGGALGCF